MHLICAILLVSGLQVQLVPDGWEEGTGGNVDGYALLPAEGAVFLTMYRLILKGTPCNPLACEQVICRTFLISTLNKEKKSSSQYLPHIDQWMPEGLQLRSSTFQVIICRLDAVYSLDSHIFLNPCVK